jgi:hypothetical protein
LSRQATATAGSTVMAPIGPRPAVLKLPSSLRHLLITKPYSVLLGQLIAIAAFFGGAAALLDYPMLFIAIGLAVLAGVTLLRGEALLDGWADTSNWEKQERLRTHKELDRYRQVLDQLTHRYDFSTQYGESVLHRYWIGETSDQDLIQTEFSTWALKGQSILWRAITTRSNAADATFQDMGFVVRDGNDYLLLKEGRELRCIVIFDPVIGSEPRNWSCSYQFKGVWDPLRSNGVDEATVKARPQTKKLEVRWVYPPGYMGEFTLKPNEGTTDSIQEAGHFVLRWQLESPRTGDYRFNITRRAIR